jgi:uncharacterized protein with ATP-grasp and redox domains
MKTSKKCVNCFLRQAEVTAAMTKLGKEKKKELLSFLTKELLKFDFNHPPVVFGRTIYKSAAKISGIEDPFAKEKLRIEKQLMKQASFLEEILKKEKDPLYAAAKFSCAANAIDFGAGTFPDLKKIIFGLKRIKLIVDHFDILKNKLEKARRLLVVGDNCGESFFDKFFIQQIMKYKPKLEVFYAVRSAPIINDVLISDAKRLGLDKVAKVFSSGCDYPGLILSKTSAYFKDIYKKADFIISKGQGNFEAFEGKKDIFYFFKVKCPSLSDFLSLPMNSLLLIHNKCVGKNGVSFRLCHNVIQTVS